MKMGAEALGIHSSQPPERLVRGGCTFLMLDVQIGHVFDQFLGRWYRCLTGRYEGVVLFIVWRRDWRIVCIFFSFDDR